MNIIETFEGFVERITDGIVYFTLNADIWCECKLAEYPNLQERRRIICNVYEDGKVELLSIPDCQLTEDDERRIIDEIEF